MDRRILAFIPARGGSKGLARKNVLPLHGKPLIAWTVGQARGSSLIDEIMVSTDDPEIAGIAEQMGVPVPFLRPPELARDDSPVSDAVFHALDWLEGKGRRFDLIVLLEPTSPLRKRHDIDDAIRLFLAHEEEADSLVSVGEIHLENPHIAKNVENGFVKPFLPSGNLKYHRQQLNTVYFPYGVVYMSKVGAFRKTRTFYQERTLAYPIERWQNYEVDDRYDLICISAVMEAMKGEF
ncbi:MAG: acylneuraminate cytidylyltransferase family protein [Methanomicrobiales archaeon]|nr:acylneuraminate cytidylyltransferase family protein [Methanomicrobiales archaeon]